MERSGPVALEDATIPLFQRERLYTKREARAALRLSDRGFDGWVVRTGLRRITLSRRAVRYLGADLLKALDHPAEV
jgi:hypothetical protein